MLLLKLALLNIGRNPRRSLITILAISVGLASLIFLQAFMDGSKEQQRDNAINLITGHLQVHAKGFDRKMSAELTVKDSAKLIEKFRQMPEVVAVSDRIKAEILIGTTQNSRGILLLGIDPHRESQVTRIHEFIKEGSPLTATDEGKVVIGKKLAEKLGAGLGDKVVVMAQAMDGTLAGYAYRIKGLIDSKSLQLDEMLVLMNLTSARDLLGLEEENHEIVLKLKGREVLESVKKQLLTELDPEVYEIRTWSDIFPEIDQWGKWGDGITQTVLLTVMLVIGIGVINTILTSVFERHKEIGVMIAIGTRPGQVVQLILFETLILELIGVMLGVVLGYIVVYYFSIVGIAFSGAEEAFAQAFMSPVTYPQIKYYRITHSIFTLITITTLIGLYPAWKAGQMEPVKAIYHS